MKKLTLSKIKRHQSYKLTDFVRRFEAEPDVMELALMRILSQKNIGRDGPTPDEMSATGSELIEAVEVSIRALKVARSRTIFVDIPGFGRRQVPTTFPPFFTLLFQ